MSVWKDIFNEEASIPLSIVLKDKVNNKCHYHKDFEICYCLKGRCVFRLQDNEYSLREGEMLLLNPYTIHACRSVDEDFAMLHLRINIAEYERFFSSISGWDFNLGPNVNPEVYRRMLTFLSRIVWQAFYKKTGYLLRIDAFTKLLTAELFDYLSAKPRQARGTKSIQSSSIKMLLSHIDENYNKNWSLEGLASIMDLNPQYLSRLFKQSVGIPLTKYINSVRIQKSVPDLMEGEKSISEIANAHGFMTVKSYYGAFSEVYDMPPRQYKRRHQMKARERAMKNETFSDIEDLLMPLFSFLSPADIGMGNMMEFQKISGFLPHHSA